MKLRVQWVVSHPIQYQAPLLRRIAQEPEFALEAIFASRFGTEPAFDPGFGQVVDFGVKLLDGYQHRFVETAVSNPDPHRFFGLRARGPIVGSGNNTVVVLHGWRTCFLFQAVCQCCKLGLPFLLRAESPIYLARGELRTWRSRPRDAVVRWLLKRSAGCLYIGSANRRFFEHRGMPSERLFHMPYYVDNEEVLAASEEGKMRRNDLRSSLGIPNQVYLIACVGKFIRRKRQRDLIRAVSLLPENVHVLFIGSGDEEAVCRGIAENLRIGARCHFAGFLPSAATWGWLGACDVFCLPAEGETWGLVVNEALVAGLPLVVTNEVGSAEDLVLSGKTGSIVPVGDIRQLRAALEDWTVGDAIFDRKSRDVLVRGHSISAAVEGFKIAAAKIATMR